MRKTLLSWTRFGSDAPGLYRVLMLLAFSAVFVSVTTSLSQAQVSLPGMPQDETNDPKIVGGNEADPGEWPWQVAVLYAGDDPYWGQYCAGSLLDPMWVVTAAHCVDYRDASYVQIIAGIHNLGYPDVGYQRINVAEIIPHPDYDPGRNDYDIALLRLAAPADFRPSDDEGLPIAGIAPVAADAGDLAGEMASVIGWGSRGEPYYDYPYSLQEVEVPIVSNDVCNDAYGGRISPRMLCAGIPEGGLDSCYGDSGGPLMTYDSDADRWELAGIVSWGYGCAEPGLPGVYSRVSEFTDWILDEIGSSFSISGRILTADGEAVQGAEVSNGKGTILVTNARGAYSFIALSPGTYTITPSKPGVTFSPQSRQVALPPSIVAQDFTAGALEWPASLIGAQVTGSVVENPEQVIVSATAEDIYGQSDSFVFASKGGSGNMELTAKIVAWNPAATNTAKSGLMIRDSISPDSSHFMIHVTGPKNTIKLKWRDANGMSTETFNGPSNATLPIWLRLSKFGGTVTGFYSYDGALWQQLGQPQEIGGIADEFRYGMAVTSNAMDRTAVSIFGSPTAAFWSESSIGLGATGQVSEVGDIVSITATGGDIFGPADSFHFYNVEGIGDADLRARLLSWNPNGNASAKAGLMIRDSNAADAPHMTVHITGKDRGIKLKYRSSYGEQTESVNGPDSNDYPVWLRIEKKGSMLTAYYSYNGTNWNRIGNTVFLNRLSQKYQYGLVVTSNSVGTYAQATFEDVRTGTLPTAPTPTPTFTPTPNPTAKPSPTIGATFTPTPTAGIPDPSPTPVPTITLEPSATPTPTATRLPKLDYVIYLPLARSDLPYLPRR